MFILIVLGFINNHICKIPSVGVKGMHSTASKRIFAPAHSGLLKGEVLYRIKAPDLDTLHNDDGTPSSYYSGIWAAEYEAVRISPTDTCMLEEIVLTAYVPSNATDSVFECTLFVWNDNGGLPGSVEFQVYSTITLQRGYWYWIYYDVSSFSRQFTGTFWIGNKKTDTNSPYNLMDAAATSGCNYWKLSSSSSWQQETYGDYMKRAVVNYAKPDLFPYTPSGWSYPLVCSDTLDDTTATPSDTLTAQDTCYIHYAFADSNSNTPYGDTIWLNLYIDGAKAIIDSFYLEDLPNGSYAYYKNYPLYVDTPGPHTLSYTIDTRNNVNEADETNNSYSITYYWKAPLQLFISNLSAFSKEEGNCIVWISNNENVDVWQVSIESPDGFKVIKTFPGGEREYVFLHWGYTREATYRVEALKNGRVLFSKKVTIQGMEYTPILHKNIFVGMINISFPEPKIISLYDLSGRLLFREKGNYFNYAPSFEGPFILKIGRDTKRIIFLK